MALYRRRLPHDYKTDQPVFLTWRLHDSLPCHRAFPAATVNSGQAFAAMVVEAIPLANMQSYIEENPVRAGWVTRGSPADRGVGPTAAQRPYVHVAQKRPGTPVAVALQCDIKPKSPLRRILLAEDKLYKAEYLGSGTFIITKPKRKKTKVRQSQLKNPQRGSRK
jgi:hypothetical protein